MVILSIAPLYMARFKAQFEMSDLSPLRATFDRYPAWGKRASWAFGLLCSGFLYGVCLSALI